MLIIGHRGAAGLKPENTLASFEAALKHGVQAIEIDVRTTRDSAAVVFHDKNVAGKTVSSLTLKQLRAVNPDALLLSDALEFLENKTEVIIELKPGCELSPVLACLEKTIAKTNISSFDFKLLRLVKKALPDQVVTVNEAWSGVRAARRARILRTPYITMNQRWLWPGFIRSMSRSGFKLSTYTLNNPAKARRWAMYGLHAVITDFPDRFK